jgi:hypothetical protein
MVVNKILQNKMRTYMFEECPKVVKRRAPYFTKVKEATLAGLNQFC